MSEERLTQEGHGANSVQFMIAVLVSVVMDKEASPGMAQYMAA